MYVWAIASWKLNCYYSYADRLGYILFKFLNMLKCTHKKYMDKKSADSPISGEREE